jgi:hypothetical protein
MSERDAKPIKVLVGQLVENIDVDIVLGKALCVLPKTELLKPVSDLLHRDSAPALVIS